MSATPSQDDLRLCIESYAEERRLANTRKKQLVKIVQDGCPPAPLDISACCGSACDPCVKELYAEEVLLWYHARSLPAPGSAS